MTAPRLLVATGNAGKLEEFKRMLAPAGVALVSPADVGADVEVEEDGLTFLANASKKARVFADRTGLATIADDSGLVVDALGGEPGVYSARYGGENLDWPSRYRLLLERMAAVTDRRARFICVVCLGEPGRPVSRVFVGTCEGRIGREPKGDRGFGYDPIFVTPDGRTMAELDAEEKDRLSHRGRAVAELLGTVDLAAWCAAVGDRASGNLVS